MIHIKYRIPRTTTAALLLGGAACGDDPKPSGGSTAGIDTSSSRIEALSKAYCEQYEDCFRTDFSQEFGSVANCIEALEEEIAEEDNKCGDAWLDYISCSTKLSCAEIAEDNECDDFFESYLQACGVDDEDYASSASGPVERVKRQGTVRKYRIPR